jgi:hypothetical protein
MFVLSCLRSWPYWPSMPQERKVKLPIFFCFLISRRGRARIPHLSCIECGSKSQIFEIQCLRLDVIIEFECSLIKVSFLLGFSKFSKIGVKRLKLLHVFGECIKHDPFKLWFQFHVNRIWVVWLILSNRLSCSFLRSVSTSSLWSLYFVFQCWSV